MTRDQAMEVLKRHGLDTRKSALATYCDCIAAKWGEGEREPAKQLKAGQSHGLIANSVVYFDVEKIDPQLSVAVEHLLTDDDRAELRKGG